MNNSEMANHQSPQALRIFYGKDCGFSENGITKRYVYGPKSVFNTTGFHLRDYRVSGFDDILSAVIQNLTVVVKHHLGSKWIDFNFDFNFLEIKLYLSNSMYIDEDGKRLVGDNNKTIRTDQCRFVKIQNDLEFDNNKKHLPNKTSRGDHPIVTYTLGSSRELCFQYAVL